MFRSAVTNGCRRGQQRLSLITMSVFHTNEIMEVEVTAMARLLQPLGALLVGCGRQIHNKIP